MKVKRLLIIVILGFLICPPETAEAQDPHFSQFYSNNLYLNPAFAGSNKCPRLSVNYRNQWPALGTAYETYSASYDQFVRELEGGVGILLVNDQQAGGAINTNIISGMYSYTLRVSRTMSVTGGFQATYIQKKLDWDFIFPDMIHPLYGAIYSTLEDRTKYDTNMSIWDFSSGFLAYTRKYFFGFAVHHLTEPQESWQDAHQAVLPRKWTVHFGTEINLPGRRFKRGELKLVPNVIFQQQQNYQQINYGIYLDRNSIVGGIYFRNNISGKLAPHADSFIMLLGFMQGRYKFCYSYDLTVSKLKNSTLGAHEISFSMGFNCRPDPRKLRPVVCPAY